VFPDAGRAADLVSWSTIPTTRRHESVVGVWSPRPSPVRLQVEDGLVTIEVSGVLDAHATAMARDELMSVCELATAVTIDFRSIYAVRSDARLEAFLDDARSGCRLTGCRLQVIASHPQVLQAMQSWGIETNSWRDGCRTRSTGVR
jgi:hypothetical protein